LKYNKIVGTGGIGAGMLFLSPINETLRRNESRLMDLSPAKDYCKQHMVLYYSSVLLKQNAVIFPIGFVGRDHNGGTLLEQMKREGMDIAHVGVSSERPTTLSVCIQYPDKSGGNFTAANGAGGLVTGDYVENCMNQIRIDDKTIVAAIPEVSIESRMRMLKHGKEKGALCVLSVPAAEADEFKREGAFLFCDFLAVNEEEAVALTGVEDSGKELAAKLYEYLFTFNSSVMLLVTCGGKGAYSVYRGNIEYIPCLPLLKVVNTTGAGDAFLGGTMAGLAMDMPIQKGANDRTFGETLLTSALELGAVCAGMAVESEDAIAKEVDLESVKRRIKNEGWETKSWFIR
jgi:sugar/nucleoside kinase (ribokinase family)